MTFEEKILLERLAELEHEQWAHWISYQLRVGVKLDMEQWKRWHDLARIPYTNLSEKEKESDREWARKVLVLLQDYIIIRKHGDLHGEKAIGEVLEWMHGKTVVDKQKLRGFDDLLNTRPHHEANTSFNEYNDWIELLEKKFRELTR